MATDRETLSKKAREIFEKIKVHFPPDPWGKPQWSEEGIVISNGTFDLRKSADREALMNREQHQIGYIVVTIDAPKARNETDRTVTTELSRRTYNLMIMSHVNLFLLLSDLDFQIATMDVVDEVTPELTRCPNCGYNHSGSGSCPQCGVARIG